MTRHWISGLIGLLFSVATLAPGTAHSCQVCIPIPEKSAADHIIAADTVVLAREDPAEPFSFRAVEVLKGKIGTPGIDLFVNSSTRRWLSADQDRSVVVVKSGSETSGPQWRSLALASPKYKAVVREILARSDRWRGDPEAQARRAVYFMPYLETKEQALHDLAYLEVGRAPYGVLRRADRFVSPERIDAMLGSLQYFEWQSLYILLLGVDADSVERERIRHKMETRARTGTALHLAPWATALIEADGAAGIAWLEREYLARPSVDPARVTEIVKALSVHGSLTPSPLRSRIVDAFGLALEHHPQLAGWFARDLATWRDWSLAETLSRLRADGLTLDSASAFALEYYLGLAAVD